jgi:hypothetical protein
MNEEAETRAERSADLSEVHQVTGRHKLIETIKEIRDKAQIRRLIIYKENGETLLDLQFRESLTMTILVTFLLPKVLALALIAPLLAGYKIQVVRRKPQLQHSPENPDSPADSVAAR